ncbi:unnamed protein product [Arctogadus glacialis]
MPRCRDPEQGAKLGRSELPSPLGLGGGRLAPALSLSAPSRPGGSRPGLCCCRRVRWLFTERQTPCPPPPPPPR